MDKIIFVCYQHGFGGENLSYRISNHVLCNKLLVKIEKGRTIIKNDLFNKIFLGFNNNFQYNFQDKEKLCKEVIKDFKNKIDKIKKYNVVPSHINVDILKKKFYNSYFITIEPPKTKEQYYQYLQHLYNDYWLYKTTNLAEYIGEIYCKIEMFKTKKTEIEIKKLTKQILSKYKNKLSFGQIQCVINDLEPTEKNMKKLFSSLHNEKKFKCHTALNFNKNYNVPFECVKSIDINKFFDYFKII
jgi:hypothetical protein